MPFTLYQWDEDKGKPGKAFVKGIPDAKVKLSFRVKPGARYQLVETQSASGYGTAFGTALALRTAKLRCGNAFYEQSAVF